MYCGKHHGSCFADVDDISQRYGAERIESARLDECFDDAFIDAQIDAFAEIEHAFEDAVFFARSKDRFERSFADAFDSS